MLIFLLCVITVPFLMENFYWSRTEMLSHYFDTLQMSLQYSDLDARKYQLQVFVNTTTQFKDYPLVEFQSQELNYSSGQSLRYSEQITFSENDISATFSLRGNDKLQAQLGIAAYGWYSFLVFVIVYRINRSIEDEVVIPFNSLKEKIWRLIIDPMIVISQS